MTRLDICAMPGCKAYTENGKRLCKKHGAAGTDLRVPKYVLDVGLEKFYAAIQDQKSGFHVESIMRQVDPLCTVGDIVNNKGSVAKLFRTLRANGYIVKKGHEDGFVVYRLGEGWDRSHVSIDEETAAEATQSASNEVLARLRVVEGALEKSGIGVVTDRIDSIERSINTLSKHAVTTMQHTGDIDAIKKQMQTTSSTGEKEDVHRATVVRLVQEVNVLAQQLEAIKLLLVKHRKEINALHERLDSISTGAGGCCPVAKMREQMHVLLGGKQTEVNVEIGKEQAED